MKKTNFDMVKEFHQVFGRESDPTVPTWPSDKELELRMELIDEEYDEVDKELFEDVDKRDITKLAKELVDLLYVTYGTGAKFGIDLNACFDEVHRSNMSKLGEDGEPLYRSDGKVLKGPNYTPPDLKQILFPKKKDK